MRRKLASQFAWVSGGRFVGAILQALLLILLARDAGPADFGMFSAVFSSATIIQTLAGFGVSTLIIRERAKSKDSELLVGGLALTIPIGSILFITLLLILVTLGVLIDVRFLYLAPLAVWAACERHADTWLGLAIADGDAYVNTVNVISRRVIALCAYTLLVGVLHPLLAFALCQCVASVVSAVTVHRFVGRRITLTCESASAKKVFSASLPFWVNSLGTQARNLDVAVVTGVAGLTQAGLYAAASRVTSPLRIVSTSLATVLLPMASSGRKRDIVRLLGLSAGVVGVMAVIYLLGALNMPWIVEVLLTESYAQAVAPLQIVLLGLCFAAGASLLSALLQGVGSQAYVARTAVTTTIFCLVSVGIGASMWGAVGASWGLFCSFFLQMVLLLLRLAKWIVAERNG